MLHRDYITLKKIIEETSIAVQMLGETELNDFMENELLKRAISMTVINVNIKSATFYQINMHNNCLSFMEI